MKRPNTIRQPRRHRWCPPTELAQLGLLTQCPHWPAEVVRVHRQRPRRVASVPVFAEAIHLSRLPTIHQPIRTILFKNAVFSSGLHAMPQVPP